MSRRQGRLSKELQEVVSIFGTRPNGGHYQKLNQRMIILPFARAKQELKGYVFEEADYIGFISPINFYIHVFDQITRQPRTEEVPRGSSNDEIEVLTIASIQTMKGKQLLQLERKGVR